MAGAPPAAAASGRSCTIFIGNIPYDTQEEELTTVFARAGAVESLRLVFDKDTKQPKGYGFCDYADPDVAAKAIRELNDVEFNGRRLRIDLADNALRSRLSAAGKAGPSGASSLPALPAPSSASLPPPSSGPSASWSVIGPPFPPRQEHRPDPAIEEEMSAHTETARIVSSLPRANLLMCLASIQRLAAESPESARALLDEHPQLCLALLHAQMLLGLDEEPSVPPDAAEMEQLKIQAAMRRLPRVGTVQPQLVPLLEMLNKSRGIGMATVLPGTLGASAALRGPRPMALPTQLGPALPAGALVPAMDGSGRSGLVPKATAPMPQPGVLGLRAASPPPLRAAPGPQLLPMAQPMDIG